MMPKLVRGSTRCRAALTFALGATLSFAAGCASERGATTQSAISASMREAVQPSQQTAAPFAVAPKPVIPAPVEERFDVDVMNADAREFFLGLVAGTNRNLIVHPDVAGTMNLTLKQVTLTEVLDTVRDVYGYDYRRTGAVYVVLPAALQTRVFELDYLNLTRAGTSRTRVSSGQVTQTRSDSPALTDFGGVADSSGGQQGSQTTGSVIDTVNNSDFWADLEATLVAILGAGEGRQVVVNGQAGVVFARGMPEELRAVGEYLERIHGAAKRQVVLEAKIIEVTLSEGYQAGVNWAAVQQQADGDVFTGGNRSGGGQLGSTPPLAPPLAGAPLTVAPGNPVTELGSETLGAAFALAFDIGDFNAFVELLETQGDTRVLSSPRVATLNNQKAVIKAGTDEFFVTEVRSNTVTGTASTTSRDVTLTPFFSGIALDVTPQISAEGEVTLHIHPTVSEVTDQTKVLTISGQTDTLPLAFSEIREADSIVKAKSGQIIAIGGLMRHSSKQVDFSTPVLGRVPGLKRLFNSERDVESVTELVILLRPIVVDDDEDWPRIIEPAANRLTALDSPGLN